jgi:hypothetical protein
MPDNFFRNSGNQNNGSNNFSKTGLITSVLAVLCQQTSLFHPKEKRDGIFLQQINSLFCIKKKIQNDP